MKSASTLLLFAALTTPAFAGDFKLTGNLEVWAYGSTLRRVGGSPYNPENRVANLPGSQWTAETRVNMRLRDETTEFVLRPRLLQQHDVGRQGDPDTGDAYLSQGFVRQRLSPAWTLIAGRELLTWGPANFRSPSNPLYFDAGKTNPLRDVSGVDLARISLTQGAMSATLAQVFSDARLTDNPVEGPLTLAKFDLRGDDTQLGLIAATPVHGAPFYGAFAQATLGDAWMLYGEFGSGQRQQALGVNPSPAGAPFTVHNPSPRKSTALLGAAYTLENGQSIALEVLYDGHGYSRSASHAVFAKVEGIAAAWAGNPGGPGAALQLRAIGQALGQTPALLGRDYAFVQWQSNPQESGQFWRLSWSQNLGDHSGQLSGYYERGLNARWSIFVAAAINHGLAAGESRRLLANTATVGVKLFAF